MGADGSRIDFSLPAARRINARLITGRIPVQVAKKYVDGLRHCQTMCCQKWKSSTSKLRFCLFMLLFLSFLKKWLITSSIAAYLILGVRFYNIYLVFLYIKILKNSSRCAFQHLIHFFRSLFFNVLKNN
jgi:hypothetical protein